MNLSYTFSCPHCGGETELSVEPFRPGAFSGPPERCYPDEGGGYEPESCEHCGREIAPDEVGELVHDEAAAAAEAAWEARMEAEEETDTLNNILTALIEKGQS